MLKKLELFEHDDTMRLIYAFRSCIGDNPAWVLESEYAKKNREIAKRLLGGKELDDYYFFLGSRFYAFSVEKEDSVIACKMKEYETFYDFTNRHLELDFSYHIPSHQIIELEPIKEVVKAKGKTRKKVA